MEILAVFIGLIFWLITNIIALCVGLFLAIYLFTRIYKKKYICVPIINKTISWSISIFQTPTVPIIGVTNVVIPKKNAKMQGKLFVVFLEYDHTRINTVVKHIQKINSIIPFRRAYLFRSRPGQNDRWHVIIPEIFTEGEWLTALAESGCDDSYKSMSMKRGYSVLRIGKKGNIPSPEFATALTSTTLANAHNSFRPESAWHANFLEKAYKIPKTNYAVLPCKSKIIGYKTGHFD